MSDKKKKFLFASLLIATILLILACVDIASFLSLESLKEKQQLLESYFLSNRLSTFGTYVALYIVVAALALPGTSILSISAGVIFGLPLGIIAVSVGSSIGAVLAFLASRYVLKDFVLKATEGKLKEFNIKIDSACPYYLLTLRLIPLVPFFLVNIAMGITRMRVTQFFLVSLIGMLPISSVYVNAGTQIASINSTADILKPGIVLSLVLLAIVPMLLKRLRIFDPSC